MTTWTSNRFSPLTSDDEDENGGVDVNLNDQDRTAGSKMHSVQRGRTLKPSGPPDPISFKASSTRALVGNIAGSKRVNAPESMGGIQRPNGRLSPKTRAARSEGSTH